MLVRRSCANLLAILVPDKDPTAFAAGDGIARYADDFADVRDIHGFQHFAFCIIDAIVRVILCHKEVVVPAFQIPHAAARKTANLLARLIINVVLVLCLLNIRDLLALSISTNSQQCHQYDQPLSHIISYFNKDEIMPFALSFHSAGREGKKV